MIVYCEHICFGHSIVYYHASMTPWHGLGHRIASNKHFLGIGCKSSGTKQQSPSTQGASVLSLYARAFCVPLTPFAAPSFQTQARSMPQVCGGKLRWLSLLLPRAWPLKRSRPGRPCSPVEQRMDETDNWRSQSPHGRSKSRSPKGDCNPSFVKQNP